MRLISLLALVGCVALGTPASAQTYNGSLQSGDATLQSGEYVDSYEVRARSGQSVSATLTSNDFDTYIFVKSPSGEQEDNDDCAEGETTRSCVTMRADDTGTYRFLVTSYSSGETGSYRLEVNVGAVSAPTVAGNRNSTSGTLGGSDEKLSSGEFVDSHEVRLSAGQSLHVEVASSDFDTYVFVKLPDGEQEDNDDCTEGETTRSCLDIVASQAGTYEIRVTSYAADETGAYTLTTSTGGGGGGQQVSVAPSSDDVRRGSLAASDTKLRSGEYVDTHRIQLAAGQTLNVEVASSDFDTYIFIKSPSGEQNDNDDCTSGDTSLSCVEIVADRSGEYVISVTSYAAGETGSYTLTTSIGSGGAGSGAVTQNGARYESGALASGDATLSSGEYADPYTFTGTGGPMIVDLSSTNFDTYLIVAPPEGDQFDNDDYDGSLDRSLITLQTVAGESYRVTVTSYASGETGAYDLTIRGEEGGGQTLASGVRQESGALDGTDEKLRSGEFVDTYTFQGVPGQRIQIDLTSDVFDTYLLVEPPRGESIQDDDGGGATGHSRVQMDLTEPGTYKVYVTSYAEGETGPYNLAMDFSERFGQPTGDVPAQPGVAEVLYRPTTRAIEDWTLSESIPGALSNSSQRNADGKFVDIHTFDGDAGEPIRIEMSSSDFDTYMWVTSPSGEQISNDDFEGDQTRSVVEFTMPETGRYRVAATSYQAGAMGSYTLQLTQRDAMLPDPPAFDRMVGVFVGVSDYSARGINSLQWTADDAATVRDAMVTAGMNPSDAILLQDSQATVGAVQNAFRDLASRTDARTMFVFFYSGHGGQYERTTFQREDPDNKDESIELYDGYILDDQFDEMLSQMPSSRELIVLDACFSGGFAKDVISRPGRMGMFSSDEDVVSNVAVKFEAGGYLSKFFADGVALMEADEDHNGGVTALELSQYVHNRYQADVRGTGREMIVARDTRLEHQKLVVDRGSVGLYDTLFLANR